MFEYCTWLTNAAGDKEGSLSLWSHSMAAFLSLKYSSQIWSEWELLSIAQQSNTFPQKRIKSFKVFSKRKKNVAFPDSLSAVP